MAVAALSTPAERQTTRASVHRTGLSHEKKESLAPAATGTRLKNVILGQVMQTHADACERCDSTRVERLEQANPHAGSESEVARVRGGGQGGAGQGSSVSGATRSVLEMMGWRSSNGVNGLTATGLYSQNG